MSKSLVKSMQPMRDALKELGSGKLALHVAKDGNDEVSEDLRLFNKPSMISKMALALTKLIGKILPRTRSEAERLTTTIDVIT